jgi:hypothetical protein
MFHLLWGETGNGREEVERGGKAFEHNDLATFEGVGVATLRAAVGLRGGWRAPQPALAAEE